MPYFCGLASTNAQNQSPFTTQKFADTSIVKKFLLRNMKSLPSSPAVHIPTPNETDQYIYTITRLTGTLHGVMLSAVRPNHEVSETTNRRIASPIYPAVAKLSIFSIFILIKSSTPRTTLLEVWISVLKQQDGQYIFILVKQPLFNRRSARNCFVLARCWIFGICEVVADSRKRWLN